MQDVFVGHGGIHPSGRLRPEDHLSLGIQGQPGNLLSPLKQAKNINNNLNKIIDMWKSQQSKLKQDNCEFKDTLDFKKKIYVCAYNLYLFKLI